MYTVTCTDPSAVAFSWLTVDFSSEWLICFSHSFSCKKIKTKRKKTFQKIKLSLCAFTMTYAAVALNFSLAGSLYQLHTLSHVCHTFLTCVKLIIYLILVFIIWMALAESNLKVYQLHMHLITLVMSHSSHTPSYSCHTHHVYYLYFLCLLECLILLSPINHNMILCEQAEFLQRLKRWDWTWTRSYLRLLPSIQRLFSLRCSSCPS